MTQETDSCDYQRYAILFVDDEANTRKYFKRLFGEKFRIIEAADGVEAMAVFRQHADEIGIIVTDQRMPNETGVSFLSKIADQYPDIIKILSTAYSDIDAAIGSVNHGGIFRYITKPWDIPQLDVTLRRAMEFFTLKRERDVLLEARMQAMGNVLISTRLAAFALAPVCAGIPCRQAAAALAAFVRTAVVGRRKEPCRDLALRSPDWAALHARQVLLVSGIEARLPAALAIPDFAGRATALIDALQASGAQSEAALRISCQLDPMPVLLDAILGRTDDERVTEVSIQVLVAFMAVYDAGGAILRIQGEALTLEVTVSTEPRSSSNLSRAYSDFCDSA
jgi:CheY-like chemotaxis protein